MFNSKKLAKHIVENSFHDKETNTLFVTNPGISFETLKSLAKKHNFTVGKTKSGEYVSIPIEYKYSGQAKDISLYDDFLSSYTYYDGNYSTLLTAYKTFDLMQENQAEIDLILDTYVAEVLSQGFIEDPLKITISNKNAQALVEKVLYKNKFFQKLPSIVKSIAKYGNYGAILQYPYLEQAEANEDEEFKRIDVLSDLVISFVNPKNFKVNVDEFYNVINYETTADSRYRGMGYGGSELKKTWQPWQFTHFLLFDELTQPYGKSVLWGMRSAFDQLTNLESLLALSRASKIQRLVFYVPLPNGINLVDAYGYMNEYRAQYLNSVFADQGSNKSGRKVPGAMSILTLPMSYDGKKVEVDHIESNIDLSSTEDVEYFLDKILRNSSLPKGYLVGEDTITTAQSLEAQDLKLKRTLIPLKDSLINGTMNLVENILTHAGYDVAKLDVEVSLNEPIQVPADVIEKYADIMELLGGALELNPNISNVNRFQFLVRMGMPEDVATLLCANSPTPVLDSPERLANFLMGQKTKSLNSTPISDKVEEKVSRSLSSDRFLKENAELAQDLKELYTLQTGSSDRTLKESVLRSKVSVKTEENE